MSKLLNSESWKYYIKLYQGSYRQIFASIILSIIQSAALLPIVFLVRYIIDDIILAKDMTALLVACLAILALHFISGGLMLYVRYLILKVTKKVIRKIREEILEGYLALPRTYYSSIDQSLLHTRIVEDTQRIDVMSNALLAQFLPSMLVSCALMLIMLVLNWLLFLMVLSIAPLLYFLSRTIAKRVKIKVADYFRSFDRFSQGAHFVLRMMDLIRVQVAEESEFNRQQANFIDLEDKSREQAWWRSAFQIFQSTLVASAGVIILLAGGYALSKGVNTIGELMAFFIAANYLKKYLNTISQNIPEMIAGNESLKILYKLLKNKPGRPYSGKKEHNFRGELEMRSLRFSYDRAPLLEDINFTLKSGQTAAIVGPNGSGKSTIALLALGFYKPQAGQVMADGLPYDSLDLSSLRRNIGVVMQEPLFFPGTIAENISYGDTEISRAELKKAAETSTAYRFIQHLPEGFETFIGPDGMLLSGGERQLLAVTRALLRRPKVLILDEPTNHLDKTAISCLMDNLGRLPDSPSVLLITHHIEIVRDFKHVFVLDKGILKSSPELNPG